MELKIYANETQTVLEAIRSYREDVESEINALQKNSDFRIAEIIKRHQVKIETLDRVYDRITEL